MNIEQAIDYVYASYLKAEPYLDYHAADSEKRNPEFSRAIIQSVACRESQVKPTVLVTGSKGKGSVSKMIAEIMGVHCRTGLMTSPHILQFNERIQIQGQPVSDEDLAKAIARVKPEFDKVEQQLSVQEYISPMGIQAAAALELFRDADVKFQVMECGKGAAYDDVNNVPHQYAVINRIFLEHTRELGDTLEKIAENKSAVITGDQKAVFVSQQEPEVMTVLEKRAQKMQVPLYQYGRDFRAENIVYTEKGMRFDVVTAENCYRDIQIPLLGTYQAKNCALAIALSEKVLEDQKLQMEQCLDSRKFQTGPCLDSRRSQVQQPEHVEACCSSLNEPAVKNALRVLEWPGRLEVLSSEPLMLLDACINRSSCTNVLEALQQLHIDKVITIIGIPSDKDYLGVAQEMYTVSEKMILTKSQNVHYKFGPEQTQTLHQKGIDAEWTESIAEAMERARKYMQEQENYDIPICILGTTSLISDVKVLAATPMLLPEV